MMKSTLLTFAFLMGCVVNEPTMVIVRNGRYFDPDRLKEIQPGLTTLQEAVRILGEPFQQANRNGRRALLYRNQLVVKRSEKTTIIPGESDVPIEPREIQLSGLTTIKDTEYYLYFENDVIQAIERAR